ncbi:hypothetical protein L6164_033340 [Bauhinia variegata]|uniref:Uncharacterized protein n=1 Tax=Bauhinia variegata TaxID=167791 RepID=A0ACB9KRH2_BAUVA|nr:hypothetical protein L6164_033340 [Bauhinia variegata]
MAIRLPAIRNAKHILRRSLSNSREAISMSTNVPKGYFAVHVGEEQKKIFVVPISYLNKPEFLELLNKAEDEFRFDHPMGGLTIPCSEEIFIDITSRLAP